MKTHAKTIIKTLLIVIVLILGSFVTSCKKDEDDTTKVTVKMTDDPFPMPFVAEANIGVIKVDLKNDNGDYVTVFSGDTSVNLVNYTNGKTAKVGVNEVPAGTYTEVRVTMGDVTVKLTDDRTFSYTAAAHHSYSQAIYPALEVSEGEKAELLIDMDLSRSFSFGGFTGWISDIMDITGIQSFTPQFRAVDLYETGTIEGQVNDANGDPVAYAEVKIRYDYDNDGQPEEVTTIAKADGSFKIIGVPQGTYMVEAEGEGTVDGEVDNVHVSVSESTSINIIVQ